MNTYRLVCTFRVCEEEFKTEHIFNTNSNLPFLIGGNNRYEINEKTLTEIRLKCLKSILNVKPTETFQSNFPNMIYFNFYNFPLSLRNW